MPILRKLSQLSRKRNRSSIAVSDLASVTEDGEQTLRNESSDQSQDADRPQHQTENKNGASVGDSLEQTKFVSKQDDSFNPDNIEKPQEKEEDTRPATREDVETIFRQFASLIHASQQPPPSQHGDGIFVSREGSSGLLADLQSMGFKDLKTVKRIFEQKASGQPQNDREYLMEATIQLASALPENSKNRAEVTSTFLNELWNGLQHPPLSYLGDDFKYRSADGSRNSYILPQLGAANTPYARSVNPVTVVPGAPPDPFLIFDALMYRKEFKPNPNRVSSIFFNWASLVIHDLFQTDHNDYSLSKTSSYLDLSILYGDTQEDQDLMRTFQDGKIKPDCFAEERLLAFPPSAGVMLIMLNRFHNHVVEQIAKINEGGRFTKPSSHLPEEKAKAAWKKYDNDLFQTGRLVTCGLYINITLYDYLRTIVNLNRTNSTWTLDPRMEKPKMHANEGTPSGVGNQVSAEFALCYRWHAAISQTDEAWTEQVYSELFGRSPEDLDMNELMMGLAKYDKDLPEDPFERPFAHLKRGSDGKFNDDDLAQIMVTGIESVAGAFGARNHPKALRAVSVLAIKQARAWNLCTFNEFRAFFGLKKFDTFAEMNSDPAVAQQLENIYGHPDYVELYPGIMVEDAKTPMVPGVGICPNHTLARAILSDAVALVRGDRFYTLDYSPKNLTAWGYAEADYDLNINQGCVFYKLMLQALPNHFKPDSIYAHYPMTVPDENAKIMKDLDRFYDYSWDKPMFNSPRINLAKYSNAIHLQTFAPEFDVMWNEGLGLNLGKGGQQFYLGSDSVLHANQGEIANAATYQRQWEQHVKQFYEETTLRLIEEKTMDIASYKIVDIVKEVNNVAHVEFAANLFNLPLKTVDNPNGIFDKYELWMAACVLYDALFLDFEPTRSYSLKAVAQKLAATIGHHVESDIKSITTTSLVSKVFGSTHKTHNALHEYGCHLVRGLFKTGLSTHDIAFSHIMPAAIAAISEQSQAFSQVLDYYLGEGIEYLSDIQSSAGVDSPESDEKLLHYILEGIRLNGTLGIYRRSQITHTFTEGDKTIRVQPGDKIFCSLDGGSHDEKVFPNPSKVDLNRPVGAYLEHGVCSHTCLGSDVSRVALIAMLRTVAKLPGIQRAPGPQGELKKIPRSGGPDMYIRERHDSVLPFPTTMKIAYGRQAPPARRTVVKPVVVDRSVARQSIIEEALFNMHT